MARSKSIGLKGEAARMFMNQAARAAGYEAPCKDTTQGVQDPATAATLNMEDEVIIDLISAHYAKIEESPDKSVSQEIIGLIQQRIQRRRAARG